MAFIAILLFWINSGWITLQYSFKDLLFLYNPKKSSLQPCFQSITIQKPVCFCPISRAKVY